MNNTTSSVRMAAKFALSSALLLCLAWQTNAQAADAKREQNVVKPVTVVKPEPASEKKGVPLPIPFACTDVRDLPISLDMPQKPTKFNVNLTKMGTVSNIDISQSSGNAQYDELARAAYSKCVYAYGEKGNPYLLEHDWQASYRLASGERLRCITSRVLEIGAATLDQELPAVENNGKDFLLQASVWDDGAIYKIKPGFAGQDRALEKALTKYAQSCKIFPLSSGKQQKISLRIHAFAPVTEHFSLDEKEYKRYSDELSKTWKGGNEYWIFHILLDNEAKAQETLDKIRNGENFEELAQLVSKDPGSARRGGNLSWNVPRVFVPEFKQALLNMKEPGLYPTIVKTSFGWHIIRVDDIRPETFPGRDEVNSSLRLRYKPVRDLLLKGEAE